VVPAADVAALPNAGPEARRLVARAKAAHLEWRARPLRERLVVIARFRCRLAAEAGATAAAIAVRPPAETLAAEILPLLECCRFLEREARQVLRTERRGGRAPLWLRGTVVDVVREPFGIVLIVAPGNYGLMLAAVQALHALTAGNAVIVKPAPGHGAGLRRFAALLEASGLPEAAIAIAAEDPALVRALLACGVDKLVFTGSSRAGRELLAAASAQLVPATLELSGWDACLVLEGADLTRVADTLVFALALNGGRTCLAPRRVIGSAAVCAKLERLLAERLAHRAPQTLDAPALPALVGDAVGKGARVVAGTAASEGSAGPLVLAGVTPRMTLFGVEVFAPVLLICAARAEEMLDWANQAPFALGVTIFGPERRARELVPRLAAGVAMINDAIVPAGHAAVPIAARGGSGFGATRGREGLLEMTRPKAVTATRARRPLHLTTGAHDFAPLLAAYAAAAYGGGFLRRLRALAEAFRFIWRERARGSLRL
jgi:acyl-CoA reductase-like NAD-dependent aldehyde dehydrogenase